MRRYTIDAACSPRLPVLFAELLVNDGAAVRAAPPESVSFADQT